MVIPGQRRCLAGPPGPVSSASPSCWMWATTDYLVRICTADASRPSTRGPSCMPALDVRPAGESREPGTPSGSRAAARRARPDRPWSGSASFASKATSIRSWPTSSYFKDLLACRARPRPGGQPMTPQATAAFEPAVGRYLRLNIDDQAAPAVRRGGRCRHPASCASTRPAPTAASTGSFQRSRDSQPLPRHRLRPALARQVLAAGRLAQSASTS